MSRRRRAPLTAWLAALALGLPTSARGQGTWDATLFVTPFPSPYLSDWETDPTIATYTLINGSDREQDVLLHYEVRNQAGTVVTTGRSDPQAIPVGAPAVYTSFSDIAGSTRHDQTLEDQVTRSGRMPEGDYTACVVATSLGGFVLAQVCETFTIVYPDPPMLIGPADGEVVSTAAPIFQWTPLQLPADYMLRFVLQVAEVRPDQTPYTALTSNVLHYENLDVGATGLVYPVDGLPLRSGATYAWRVVAMDQNGYAAAANGGSSEVWTFRYDDGTGGGDDNARRSLLTLSLQNDPQALTLPLDTGTTGLAEICSEWTMDAPLGLISLPLASRLLFQTDTMLAELVRGELSDGQRVWAIAGRKGGSAYLAYGDCDGPNRKSVLRWVGRRLLQEAEAFHAWLGLTPDTTAQDRWPRIKFGVGIFSFYDMTATAGEDTFALNVVRDFLEDREIDVQPGFNLFQVIDGNQAGVLGAVAEFLHTTTKDFEFQGFAGFNNSINAGVSLGRSDQGATGLGADIGMEFVILQGRGSLPAWENPGWDWIKSLQLGVEVVVKDSVAYGWGEREPGLKNSFEVMISPTLTLVTADDITFTGLVGLDFTRNDEGEIDPHLVVKLASDAKWRPARLRGMDVYIGNPEIEFDVEDLPSWTSIKENGFGAFEWSLGVSGSLGWGNEEAIAKVGVTFGRKANQSWAELVAKDSALAKADSVLIETSRANLSRAEARGDTAAGAFYRQQLADREERLRQTLRTLRADAGALEQLDRGREQGERRGARPPSGGGAWWWKARIAFGNLSILDLVDLVRKAIAGGP